MIKRPFHTAYYMLAVLWLCACGTAPADEGILPITLPRRRPTAKLTPIPTPALDICLFGEWRLVDDSLAAFLSKAVLEGQASEYQLLEAAGFLSMQFDEKGGFRMAAEDYGLTLLVTPESASFLETRLQIDLPADGTGKYLISEGVLIAFGTNYEGGLPAPFPIRIRESGVTTAPLHVNPGWFIDQMWTETDSQENLMLGTAVRSTNYNCSAEQLSLEAGAYGPVLFTRWVKNTR